jgi:hypothetical protein
MNVLLLTCGNESSIEIIKSLAQLNVVTIHGAHYEPLNPSHAYLNKDLYFHEIRNLIYPQDFLDDVAKLVQEHNIELIFTTNCKIIKLIYDNYSIVKGLGLDELLLLPNYDTLKYCLFKDKLYEKFPQYSPIVYNLSNKILLVDKLVGFFAKPAYGSSAENARRVNYSEAIELSDNDEYVVTENLPGEEVTVDCLSSSIGKLEDFNVRSRSSVRNGITNIGMSLGEPIYSELQPIIYEISQELKIPYIWFIQFKRNSKGVFKLLEINCRVSGSFSITKTARKDYIQHLFEWFQILPDEHIIVKGAPQHNDIITLRHFNSLEYNRKRYVVDIDGTICTETRGFYQNAKPIGHAIKLINELYDEGAEIIFHTARGMVRFNNDIAKVYDNLFSLTQQQLKEWGVKYDKLILGKPAGTYIDNKMETINGMIAKKGIRDYKF